MAVAASDFITTSITRPHMKGLDLNSKYPKNYFPINEMTTIAQQHLRFTSADIYIRKYVYSAISNYISAVAICGKCVNSPSTTLLLTLFSNTFDYHKHYLI